MQQKTNTSETKTENIFRNYYGADAFIEKSAIPKKFGFKSKNQTDKYGYPDFFREEEDFVYIVEAKPSSIEDAIEDVKFYSENNKVKKDIVAVAIAGQTVRLYKAVYFIKLYGQDLIELETNGKLLPFKDINKLYRKEKFGESISTESLIKTLKGLNKTFNDPMKIKDTERSLFFAGLMIALKDTTFRGTYKNIAPPDATGNGKNQNQFEAHNLNEAIVSAISKQISGKVNNHSKEYNWRDRFSFIMNIDYGLEDYKAVIQTIEDNIFVPFKNDEKQDILGRAYKIFLSKAGKIDNKNIIITPEHIKALMVELARLTVDDVVIDTCTGSGGFLMEAMEVMTDLAKNSSTKITEIQEKQLIGFEVDATLFALACSNMFLHGDGRTNLIYGSSLFRLENDAEKATFDYVRSLSPKKCIINPPYENNNPILFTKQAIELLEPNGRLIIIMPTPTLKRNVGGLTEEILSIAKLDFVIKMPNNLFAEQNRAVNTSIFGFTKTPHKDNDMVLFYNMEDDGHVSVQHKGRVDKRGKWKIIKNSVVECISNSKEKKNLCEKRLIIKKGVLNCYGYKKKKRVSNYQLIAFDKLFQWEKGSLASENCEDEGEYDFITASEEWKKHTSYDKDQESIVYAVSAGGSLGRAHYVNGKFIASNLCLILTPKNPKKYPIDLQFYTFYLNHIRKQVVSDIADGTSKPTINPKDLEGYYINYYPIDEQKKYVDLYNMQVKPIIEQYQDRKKQFEDTLDKAL